MKSFCSLNIICYICERFFNVITKMNIENIVAKLDKRPNLSTALGMEFISTPDPNTAMARMKVDERNRQPFGFLSGGASLALAENLAGVGSLAVCPGKIAVGINVSGSHVKAVLEGDTITATARLMNKGNTLHQWQVDIVNEAEELICTVQVTNYIMRNSKK